MKIVIDIPKYVYDTIIANDGYIADCDNEKVGMAVKNGTPIQKADGDLISRDYVIEQIKKAQENGYVFTYDTLIDFVKVLPTIPQVECTEKPCLGKLCAYYTEGDLISRKAVLDCIGMTSLHYDLARRLRKLPTIPQTDSVLEDIRAEIEAECNKEEYGHGVCADQEIRAGYLGALAIVNKHISRKENE